MTPSAHHIAAVLRQRLPGVGVVKLHKLLYYCQGHHLATFGEPLFVEDVFAWDNGPVVSKLWNDEKEGLTAPPGPPLGEGELNTIGYVLSRYGRLTKSDLINMTHQELPWRYADANRIPNTTAKIQRRWLIDYFAGEGAPDDGYDGPPLDTATLQAMLDEAAANPIRTGKVDTVEALLARIGQRAT